MPKARLPYHFAKIFTDEIWRFYIDYYRQSTKEGTQKGSLLFDVEEPGYMAAMMKAHQLMNETLSEKLTPNLILRLYKAALEGVSKTNLTDFDRFDRFRSDSVSGFWLKMNTSDENEGNVSNEGLREFLEEMIANNNENKFEIWDDSNKDILEKALLSYKESANKQQGLEDALSFLEDKIKNRKCKFVSPNMTHQTIEKKINQYIHQYESKLKKLSDNEEKLEVIIELIQKIERLHPFIDGNCRTLVMLVLNRELIRNGFMPTMQWNPNRFDFFSREQLRTEIINGWEYSKKYQSEIANLNSYKVLYEYVDKLYQLSDKSLFHKQETATKARNLDKLLGELKTKSPKEGSDFIQENWTKFKSSRGVITRIFRLETTTEGLLKNLMNDVQEVPVTKPSIGLHLQ
ncbi:Fic family protein [Legionella brunensis]|uniref:Ankyrin repeat-containing protein n=1 Tax=Legionella brunensis TaxID=29422 RepID=A0A0W0SMF2_9GAMM|nr:Fic family protein [Legionella brunensis]KTC84507.1 ankyrin repeat-containing protein [Legionella brunensis]